MIFITSQMLILASLLLGCSNALNVNFSENQTMPRVGKEFSIKAGQQVKFDDAEFALKFTRVVQDSRCPTDVNCVWAGNAEVALNVNYDKCAAIITLNTHRTPETSDEDKVGGFRVKLIKLDPYPHSQKKISPEDYTATLLVTKE